MSGNCSSPNQSPINLSQSFSQPCDLLCQLVFDDVYPTSTYLDVEPQGLVLNNTAGLGSCKFNDDGYNAMSVTINHPSNHTIESIQADVEVSIVFKSPTKGNLLVCFLAQSNPNPSNSSQWFNSIVKYADPSKEVEIPLGSNWSLANLVPTSGEYFVYDGTIPFGNCDHAKVVVFKSMINIDPSDFVTLSNKVPAASRPIQGLGERSVYFNASKQLPGGPMPMDNRAYLVFRENPKKAGINKAVTVPGISDAASTQKAKSGITANVSDWVTGQVETNGIIGIFDIFLLILSFAIAFYFGFMKYQMFTFILFINEKAGVFGKFLRSLFIQPPSVSQVVAV